MTRVSGWDGWTLLLLDDLREGKSNFWSLELVLDRLCSFVLDGLRCWPSPLVRTLGPTWAGDIVCLGLGTFFSFGFLKRNFEHVKMTGENMGNSFKNYSDSTGPLFRSVVKWIERLLLKRQIRVRSLVGSNQGS